MTNMAELQQKYENYKLHSKKVGDKHWLEVSQRLLDLFPQIYQEAKRLKEENDRLQNAVIYVNHESLIKALSWIGEAGPDGLEDCAAREEYFVNRLIEGVLNSKMMQTKKVQLDKCDIEGCNIKPPCPDCGECLVGGY